MLSSRSIACALALFAAACGSQPAPSPDASAMTDASAMSPADASAMPPADASAMPPADASAMMPEDSGPPVMAGMCGAMTRDCICGCGMNGQCQNQCISGNMQCSQCVVRAQAACCPMQAQALAQCAQAAQMGGDGGAPCMDTACVLMRCNAQAQALQMCFATAQSSDMRCQTALGVCFGAFPLMCN
jgi:hypothetical protein